MKKIQKNCLEALKNHKNLQRQLVLFVVFSVLLLSFYLFQWIRSDSHLRPILKLNPTSFSRILFSPVGKDAFSLEKDSSGDWALVSGDLRYPSWEEDIRLFLNSLTSLEGIEMQEQDKKTFKLSSVPFLVFYKGNQEEEALFLGERNTLKREIYIQRKSDNKVFLSPDIFSSLISRGLVALVDNRLFPSIGKQELILMETIPLVDDARELTLKGSLTYTKTLTGWKSSRAQVPDSASFGSLNLLKATQVLANVPVESAKNPHYEITLLWANNHQEKLTLYKGLDERFLVSVKGSPYAYLLDPASLLQFYEKP